MHRLTVGQNETHGVSTDPGRSEGFCMWWNMDRVVAGEHCDSQPYIKERKNKHKQSINCQPLLIWSLIYVLETGREQEGEASKTHSSAQSQSATVGRNNLVTAKLWRCWRCKRQTCISDTRETQIRRATRSCFTQQFPPAVLRCTRPSPPT